MIFRTDEWMAVAKGDSVSEPPSDDDAVDIRHAQENETAKHAVGRETTQSYEDDSGPMDESVERVRRKQHREENTADGEESAAREEQGKTNRPEQRKRSKGRMEKRASEQNGRKERRNHK